ncbi:MAG: alpha/beta hydrolase [Pseudomonadota bacterium]
MTTVRKGYSDGPEGQIHWRMATSESISNQPDLFCFSPAPFGSIAYASLLPLLAKDMRVCAPDYPGQAGSDGGSATPSIESYATSMLAVIQDLSNQNPVNLLGFHSGCLVAAEVQRQAPQLVERVVLVDVPAFDPETRAKYLPMVGAPFEPTADLDSVSKAWEMAVSKRLETQTLEHCLAMFADAVGNGRRMNATFHAAFTYDVEIKLSALDAPTTVIASQSGLLSPSRRAAAIIPNCELVEMLSVKRSVLDENARTTADAIRSALA